MSKISFGKHKGKSWKAVVQTEPDYFEWVLVNYTGRDTLGPSESDLAEYLFLENNAANARENVEAYKARMRNRVMEEAERPAPQACASTVVSNTIQEFENTCVAVFGSFPYKAYQTY